MCRIVVLSIALFAAAAFAGNFADDFQAAAALFRAGQWTAAEAAFRSVAETAPTPESKAEALTYAAHALNRQEKPDEALDLARSIDIERFSIHCRMDLLLFNRQEKTLIAEFRDTPIDQWPECLIPKGYYTRGQAYLRMQEYHAAVDDLERAAVSACDETELIETFIGLGWAYRNVGRHDDALAAYEKAIALDNRGQRLHPCILARAAILREQEHFEKALAELDRVDVAAMHGGHWHCRMLRAYGETYEAQGNREKAIQNYREALQVENAHPSDIAALRQKLDELQ